MLLNLKRMQDLAEKRIEEILGLSYITWFEDLILQRLNIRSMSAVFTRDELHELVRYVKIIDSPGYRPDLTPFEPILPIGWDELPFLYQSYDWDVKLVNDEFTMTLVNEHRIRIGGPEPQFRNDTPFDEFMKLKITAHRQWLDELKKYSKGRY